jgi:hypothetical protein
MDKVSAVTAAAKRTRDCIKPEPGCAMDGVFD